MRATFTVRKIEGLWHVLDVADACDLVIRSFASPSKARALARALNRTLAAFDV